MLSYRELATGAARMFRFLGLLTGPEITTDVAAALMDLASEDASRLLENLVDTNLLESDSTPGRYRVHDLVRVFARERADIEEAQDDRRAAIVRALRFYLATTWRTFRLLRPGGWLPRGIDHGGPRALAFASDAEAVDWLEVERTNLVAAVHQAASEPGVPPSITASLAHSLFPFFDRRSYWTDWEEVSRTALAFARRHCDRDGEARALNALGVIDASFHRLDDAVRTLTASVAIYRELDDGYGESAARANLANSLRQQRLYDLAVDHLQRALAIRTQLGDHWGEAAILLCLGEVYCEQQRYAASIDSYRLCVDICRYLGDRKVIAEALGGLGSTYRRQGQYEQAVEYLEQSLAIRRQLADRWGQADALFNLGETHSANGRHNEALTAYRESLAISRDLGDSHAEDRTCQAVRQITAVQSR
jgi:tetratricopeptide (TPR) repeat protein